MTGVQTCALPILSASSMCERVHIIYSWDKFQSNEKVKKKSENTNLPAQNEKIGRASCRERV